MNQALDHRQNNLSKSDLPPFPLPAGWICRKQEEQDDIVKKTYNSLLRPPFLLALSISFWFLCRYHRFLFFIRGR
jgi:hypothetical protein